LDLIRFKHLDRLLWYFPDKFLPFVAVRFHLNRHLDGKVIRPLGQDLAVRKDIMDALGGSTQLL
jgi:hypothetical protein